MPSNNDALIRRVQTLRTMLVDVGTGIKRVQDVEAEYTQLRGGAAQKLRELGIPDVNGFFSLWDWYKYWKENGLASYQSRRDYINGLYKPVIEALERGAVAEPDNLVTEAFSVRHGYVRNTGDAEITIREDAPDELRRTIIDIATQKGWDYETFLMLR